MVRTAASLAAARRRARRAGRGLASLGAGDSSDAGRRAAQPAHRRGGAPRLGRRPGRRAAAPHTRADFPAARPRLAMPAGARSRPPPAARPAHRDVTLDPHPPLDAVRRAVQRRARRGPRRARRPERRPRPGGPARAPLVIVAAPGRRDRRRAVRAGGVRPGRPDRQGRLAPARRVAGRPAGPVVAEVSGPLRSILTAERTALNFLGRLSGIATLTRRYVDAVARRQPADPRPRHPQDDARACGRSRRRRCAPAAATTTASASPTRCSSRTTTWPASAITEAVRPGPGHVAGPDRSRSSATGSTRSTRPAGPARPSVLLDNMSAEQAARLRRARGRPAAGRLDAGRGVRRRHPRRRAPRYAAAGVDLISVGALTHSAPGPRHRPRPAGQPETTG